MGSHRRRARGAGDKGQFLIYLTPSELETLTGYKRPADQARWLDRNGVPFTMNARGRPVVRKDMDKTAVATPELGTVR